MEYTARNIKILSKDELEKFTWVHVEKLAEQFPNKRKDFIAKGLEACRRCSVDPSYFIMRYLQDDKTVPLNDKVQQAYVELMHE